MAGDILKGITLGIAPELFSILDIPSFESFSPEDRFKMIRSGGYRPTVQADITYWYDGRHTVGTCIVNNRTLECELTKGNWKIVALPAQDRQWH